MQIILASTSPRRREIMDYFSLPYESASPDFDEKSVPFEGDPKKFVETLAIEKAKSAQKRFPQALIIAADTTVYIDGKVFEKPEDPQEALEALCHLAGRWHTVYTGVALLQKEKLVFDVEATRVLFHPVTPLMAHRYQKAVHSFDKAGGYAIQGAGQLIIEKIEGCYSNVVGLPITVLQKLLRSFDIDLWNYLR